MLSLADRPRLRNKARLRWDERAQKHLLVYPERGLELNAMAARIVALADGTRSVAAIVDALAGEFRGARETIERETLVFLDTLEQKLLLERA